MNTFYIPVFFRKNYNLFLEATHDEFNELRFNFSGIKLEPILKIIEKIEKCTKLSKLFITSINSEYLDKINFNFLANFGLLDIVDISFTSPFYNMLHFATDDNCLILLNLSLDVKNIHLTNFTTNTRIIIGMDNLKEATLITNNLSSDVHNLTLQIKDYYKSPGISGFCDFIDNGLNNLPTSLKHLKFYHDEKIFGGRYHEIIFEKINKIKRPLDCIVHVESVNFAY